MPTGTIKTKTDKGFGFIKLEGSPDVFFHSSACNEQFDNLNVGQMVSFDLEQGDKGPKAVNVVVSEGGDVGRASHGDESASPAPSESLAA